MKTKMKLAFDLSWTHLQGRSADAGFMDRPSAARSRSEFGNRTHRGDGS